MAQPRRGFLQQATMAAALAISPFASRAQQQDTAEPATAAASSSVIATFDDVWRTVRDRFYDPQLHGLDWSAVRKRYLPDAAQATSEEALATVINRMLSELHASHTHYYTPDEPETISWPTFLRPHCGGVAWNGLFRAGGCPILVSASSRGPDTGGGSMSHRCDRRHAGPACWSVRLVTRSFLLMAHCSSPSSHSGQGWREGRVSTAARWHGYASAGHAGRY